MTARPPSQSLAALDAAFLGLESREVPFVHASILCFDQPIALDALRDHVDAALAGVTRYRQRIARSWRSAARWVMDDDYRIEHHVLAIEAAAPGGIRELERLAARLLEGALPADHSPWRVWTVTGLADGRGAVISLFHHSLIDGITGFRLLEYVLGGPRVEEAPRAEPEAPPAGGRLATLRSLARWRNVGALARLLRDGLRPASQIGLNPRHNGPSRVVASHTVELDTMTAIARAFGATNNDVVLAAVAGALRRYLARHGRDPSRLHDVRAMVPVGRHAKGSREAAGNRVVLLLAALPVDEPDPVARMARVTATTRRLKTGHSVAGGELLVALSEATTPWLLVGAVRLALRFRGFNLIVTNVPGPRAGLALLGAQLTQIVPIVNLWPHHALGIAAASYAGTMAFGIHADREVVPDADAFRDDLSAAFDELRASASLAARAASPGSPAPVRAMQATTA